MPTAENTRVTVKVTKNEDFTSSNSNHGMVNGRNGVGNNLNHLKVNHVTRSTQRQLSSKDDTLKWIQNEQDTVLSLDMDKIGKLETRNHILVANEEIQKVLSHDGHFIPHSDTQVKEELETVIAYNNLKKSQQDQIKNLEFVEEVTKMENHFNILVKNIATTAKNMKVKLENCEKSPKFEGNMAPLIAQKNLLHTRTSFDYLLTLNKLTKIHTKHSKDYFMYFREIDQYSGWMAENLTQAESLLSNLRWKKNPELGDVQNFLSVLQEVMGLHSYWQNKLKELGCRGKHLIPVPQRLLQQKVNTRVTCLADYKARDALLKKSEEVFLISNSDDNIWKVKNFGGVIVEVPSIFVVIPGPALEALEALKKLKQEFITSWTNLIKKSGLIFLAFLTTIFKDWNNAEKNYIKSMSTKDRQAMDELISNVRQLFFPFWKLHPIFQSVDEKMINLEQLQSSGEKGLQLSESEYEEITTLLLKDPELINQLITQYDEFWTEWVTCKTSQEIGNMHEGNKRKLQSALSFGTETDFSFSYDEVDAEFCGSEVYMIATAKETTESSQYSHSEQEERQTFVITGVKNPRDGTMISLDEAVYQGIINQEEGKYFTNLESRENIPIPLAMNSGYIKVELTRTKKSEEKRSELGLVTLRTVSEQRPFTIRAVRDPHTSRQMSLEQAVKRGLVDQKARLYRNKKTGEDINFLDAIDSGLIIAEFEETAGEIFQEQVVTKTYAVYEVLDTLSQKQLTFSKAVAVGILNQDSGVFLNRAKRESIPLSEAIKRGFIRATVVTDPKTFDMTYSPTESDSETGFSQQNSPATPSSPSASST